MCILLLLASDRMNLDLNLFGGSSFGSVGRIELLILDLAKYDVSSSIELP